MEERYDLMTMRGIYRKGDKQDTPPGFFYDLKNVIRTDRGLRKRNGFVSDSEYYAITPVQSYTKTFRFDYTDPTTKAVTRYLIHFTKTAGIVRIDILNLELVAGYTSYTATDTDGIGYLIGSAVTNNWIVFKAQGSKYLYKWNPTIVSDDAFTSGRLDLSLQLTNWRAAWDIVEKKNRIYIGGGSVSAYNDSVLYSAALDLATWTSDAVENDITCPAKRGMTQVRIFKWVDDILILTNRFPMLIKGDTISEAVTGEFVNSEGMNAVYPEAATMGKLGVYYLGNNAVHRFTGQYSLDISTAQIPAVIKGILRTATSVFMWSFDRYIVLTCGTSAVDQRHWIYDEIEQKWVGYYTSSFYFVSVASEWKCGGERAATVDPQVYLLTTTAEGGSTRVYLYPGTDHTIYEDTTLTTTTNIDTIIEIPSRDVTAPHLKKDLEEIHIGTKVSAGAVLDAALSIDESAFNDYNESDLTTKRIALDASQTTKDDSYELFAGAKYIDYTWLSPRGFSVSSSGFRIGLKLSNTNGKALVIKYIVMKMRLSKGEEVRQKEEANAK